MVSWPEEKGNYATGAFFWIAKLQKNCNVDVGIRNMEIGSVVEAG